MRELEQDDGFTRVCFPSRILLFHGVSCASVELSDEGLT